MAHGVGERVLRSALFVPGANARALEKARELPADALILDLEDAVAPQRKAGARAAVCQAIGSGALAQRTVAVRVNGAGTSWHRDDLAAAVSAGPDAIVLPKVRSAHDVLECERVLATLGAAPGIRLWAMLETPAAVLRSAEIAACGERLDVLVVGTNDLRVELRVPEAPGRRGLELSLMLCVLGARAAGRRILDGVHNDPGDAAGFEAECGQARQLGFDGKTLIHPAQIEICHRAFTPSPQEIERAQRIIDAYAAAVREGTGVTTVDGRLIERLDADAARETLERAGPQARDVTPG